MTIAPQVVKSYLPSSQRGGLNQVATGQAAPNTAQGGLEQVATTKIPAFSYRDYLAANPELLRAWNEPDNAVVFTDKEGKQFSVEELQKQGLSYLPEVQGGMDGVSRTAGLYKKSTDFEGNQTFSGQPVQDYNVVPLLSQEERGMGLEKWAQSHYDKYGKAEGRKTFDPYNLIFEPGSTTGATRTFKLDPNALYGFSAPIYSSGGVENPDGSITTTPPSTLRIGGDHLYEAPESEIFSKLVKDELRHSLPDAPQEQLDYAANRALKSHLDRFGVGYQSNSPYHAVVQDILNQYDTAYGTNALSTFQNSPRAKAVADHSSKALTQFEGAKNARSDADDADFYGDLGTAFSIVGALVGVPPVWLAGGNAAINLAGGADFDDVLKSAALTYAGGEVGKLAGAEAFNAAGGVSGGTTATTVGNIARNVASTATRQVGSGQGLDLEGLAKGAALGEIDRATGLPISTIYRATNRPDGRSPLQQVADNKNTTQTTETDDTDGGGWWSPGYGRQQEVEKFGAALGPKKNARRLFT